MRFQSYDFHFICTKCGIEIETSLRVTKDIDTFFGLVDRIHPRRCPSAPSEAERGKRVEYGPGNSTAGLDWPQG